jgi:hypothetical protein
MQTGVARTYIGSASQVKDEVLTPAKLSFIRKYARVYRSGTQTLAAATPTKIQFNAKSFDPAAMFDEVTNYRLTVPAGYAGKWLISAALRFLPPAGNSGLYAAIYVNGIGRAYVYNFQTTASAMSVMVTDILNLAAGDYVEIYGYTGAGGDISGSETLSWADFAYLASDSAITPP